MADIQTYLQQILDAVYGEEVRGSIHDAISQMNSDLEDAIRDDLNPLAFKGDLGISEGSNYNLNNLISVDQRGIWRLLSSKAYAAVPSDYDGTKTGYLLVYTFGADNVASNIKQELHYFSDSGANANVYWSRVYSTNNGWQPWHKSVDNSLSLEGAAADAKAVNTAINNLLNEVNTAEDGILGGDRQYLDWNEREAHSNYWYDQTTNSIKKSATTDDSFGTFYPLVLNAGTYYLHMIAPALSYVNTTKISEHSGYTEINSYNGTLTLSEKSTLYLTTYHPQSVRWSYSMLSTSYLTSGTTSSNNSYRFGYYNEYLSADNASDKLYAARVHSDYAYFSSLSQNAKIQFCNSNKRTASSYWNYYDSIMHIGTANNYWRFDPIYLPKGSYYGYYISNVFSGIETYDKQYTKLVDYPGFTSNGSKSTLVLNNDALLYITGLSEQTMIFNYNEDDNTYKDFGVYDGDGIHHSIYVGPTRQYTTIISAIQSIPSGTWLGNQYDIFIDDGTYNEYEVRPGDGVNLIGLSGNRDSVKIVGKLPASSDNQTIEGTCTVVLTKSNVLKNITVTAQNMRYPIHSESGGIYKRWRQILENVAVIHKGTEEVSDYRSEHGDSSVVWTSTHAWGEGASAESYAEFNNCYFEGGNAPFYVHDSTATDSNKPYLHILNNCKIVNNNPDMSGYWNTAVIIDNSTNRSCNNNTVEINNCNFGNGCVRITNTYPIIVTIHGCNNAPVRVDHIENGYPESDYVTLKKYIGSAQLQSGDILKYDKHVNYVSLATSSTPIELIAGMYVGSSANTGDIVQVISGTYENIIRGASIGTLYYADNNGKLVTQGTIPIAVSIGEFAKLLSN